MGEKKRKKNTGASIPSYITICCVDSVDGNLRMRHVPWRKHALDRLWHFFNVRMENRVIVAVEQFRVCPMKSTVTSNGLHVREPLIGHRETWTRPTIDLPADDELNVWEKCTQRTPSDYASAHCTNSILTLFLICYSNRFRCLIRRTVWFKWTQHARHSYTKTHAHRHTRLWTQVFRNALARVNELHKKSELNIYYCIRDYHWHIGGRRTILLSKRGDD